MSAPLAKQLAGWADRHTAAPSLWPGDNRPLWRRALDQRVREQNDSERQARAKENGRKGGFASRTHKPIAVGDEFGTWRVTRLLGRGYQGRSDMRVAMECQCGATTEAFEYMARKRHGPCTHPHRGRP